VASHGARTEVVQDGNPQKGREGVLFFPFLLQVGETLIQAKVCMDEGVVMMITAVPIGVIGEQQTTARGGLLESISFGLSQSRYRIPSKQRARERGIPLVKTSFGHPRTVDA
jgi:hypothetical protein